MSGFVLRDLTSKLILQNIDNVQTILDHSIVDKNRISLIKGAGVEIGKFQPSLIPKGPYGYSACTNAG